MTNMKSVLGPNPLFWLVPQKMRGEGLSFPVNPDAGGESSAEWADIAGRDREARPEAESSGSSSSGTANGFDADGRHRQPRGVEDVV